MYHDSMIIETSTKINITNQPLHYFALAQASESRKTTFYGGIRGVRQRPAAIASAHENSHHEAT